MLNRAPVSLQRLLGRVAPVAVIAARLYVALVFIQFLAGFVVGVSVGLFDYDLAIISNLLTTGG